jgi:hypothetical protein
VWPHFWARDDCDIPIETPNATKQPLQRESSHAAGHQCQYFGLFQAEKRSRCGLRQPLAFENVADCADQLGLQQVFLGIVEAEIGKDISASAGYRDFLAHAPILPRYAALRCCSARFKSETTFVSMRKFTTQRRAGD